jgi:hypothetical protein
MSSRKGIQEYLLSNTFYMYFFVTLAIFSVSIFFTWTILNPDESKSSTVYPYYLSIQHPIIGKDGPNRIFVSVDKGSNANNTLLG